MAANVHHGKVVAAAISRHAAATTQDADAISRAAAGSHLRDRAAASEARPYCRYELVAAGDRHEPCPSDSAVYYMWLPPPSAGDTTRFGQVRVCSRPRDRLFLNFCTSPGLAVSPRRDSLVSHRRRANPLNANPVVLKVLLQHRHLQTYSTFCREYDRAAVDIDPTLRGGRPSKAQFYRWLSGDLVGLPYADHCRILEGMFPGWKVDQLFQAHDGGIEFVPQSATPQKQPPTIRPILPTEPADQSADLVSATMSDVLDSIERGLGAPANGQAGWRSDVLAEARTVSPATATFPLNLGSSGSSGSETGEAPAQRIARSLAGLAKQLRMSDAEVVQLAKLAGHIVELDVTCSIDIDGEGWSTVTYSHQLLNLTNRPIKRLTRELWFETTDGSLVIEPSPGNDRKVAIQRTHDMNHLSKFACHISPGIDSGDVATIWYFCRGGRFVHDHYWRQAVPRYTRHLTLNIRHRGVHMLLNCTAIEEQADGSEVSAIEDLVCTDDDGDALISVTRDYLQPSQAVTLRWEVSRAAS